LIKLFQLQDLGKAPGVWDPDKLLWLNGHYIRERSAAALAELARPFYKEKGLEVALDDRFQRMIELAQPRVTTIAEFPEKTAFYFGENVEFEEKARAKFLKPETVPVLEKTQAALSALGSFDEKAIESAFVKLMEELSLKLGKIAQPVRVAVTGRAESPGLFEVLAVLGQETTLLRIKRAIEQCK